ncbi:metallophosphoesterase [uncultured Clostridium sp.]|uniref:metallophosphoesterase family protein n=1 Tax=uncultured Clostridium sp. TaxID=59620 RepID=UPI002587546C|nr:metallophosphoesterase [uncultured Clostridium sp.]MDU1349431.1 metallophosphoesterase [Clostridium argentinense]
MKIKKFKNLLFFIVLTLMVSFYAPTVYSETVKDTTYIGVTSDIHHKIPNLEKWLSNLKSTTTSMDYMIFGGDYVGPDDAESCVSAVKSQFNGTPSILAKGNHDKSKGGKYDSGLVVNNSNYAIYVMDSSSKSFTTEDMKNLESSLNDINSSKPVFVVSHCPIHYFGKRTIGNAEKLLSLLNNYENVIFLWGHNHSQNDTNYGTVKVKGDTIQSSKSSSAVPINFTYANMGSMKQGNNGAYGLLINLINSSGNTNIKFYYKDLSGKTVSNYSVNIK